MTYFSVKIIFACFLLQSLEKHNFQFHKCWWDFFTCVKLKTIRLLVKLCLIQSSTVLGLNNFCIHQFYLLEIWSCFLEKPTRYCWLESIRILSTISSEDISVCWREGISSRLGREMMILMYRPFKNSSMQTNEVSVGLV